MDKRRVLLVEDEYLAALTTIDVLNAIGCEVVGPAARLSEALVLAESEDLDAAILDMSVAGEMVWPLAELLKGKDVPFVFLSAYTGLDVVPPPFLAAPCLAKPLEPQGLVRELNAMWDPVQVDLRRARREAARAAVAR